MEYYFTAYDFLVTQIENHWLIAGSLFFILMLGIGNWTVQRNPHMIANGYMSLKKGKEIAPEIFGKPEE